MDYLKMFRFLFSLATVFHLNFQQLYAQQHTKAEKIDRYIQNKLANNNIPGLAVAVVHYDTIIISKGYGLNSDKKPLTANSPFAIASLSKGFTAMAVMQLVGCGLVDLDKPVINYLPSFTINDSHGSIITVRNLLNQTSGLADAGFPELAFKQPIHNFDELILRLKSARLVSKPGQQFHYHNPNYEILAKLVEEVSHERFSDYLQKHIFDPLTMTHTWDVLSTKSFNTDSRRLSDGHIYFLGKPIVHREPEWFVEGAAGIISSADDMAHWLTVQLKNGQFNNTELLKSKYMNMMHLAPPGTSSSYGMGWFLNKDSTLYHSGILWTYSSQQILFTKNGYGIVMLFNGGTNAFVDYYSFLGDINDIINNIEPESSFIPTWLIEGLAGLVFLTGILSAIRQLLRLKQWFKNYYKRPVWRSCLYMILRLMPLLLLVFVPRIITLLSGRVLNWSRIFLMFPDIIIGFGLIGLINLIVVLSRFIYLFKNFKSLPTTLNLN